MTFMALSDRSHRTPGRLVGAAGVLWTIIAVVTLLGWGRFQFIELLFLLAPLVVVPMAVPLILRPAKDDEERDHIQGMVRILFGAGVFAAVSFLWEPGGKGAWLAFAWLLAWAVLVKTLTKISGSRVTVFGKFCFTAGTLYLGVGAIWLAASRLGFQPLGFHEPIVLLTAVHFHFAGFACAVMAGLLYERLHGDSWAGWMRLALLGTILGPGALGLAFLIGPQLKLVAVFWIALGEIALAAGFIRVAATARNPQARWLLRVAAASLVVGILLAAGWALGEYPLHPFLNIEQMTRVHGVLNAIGFGVCGLLGWSRIGAEGSEVRESNL